MRVLRALYHAWQRRHPVVLVSIGQLSWYKKRARKCESGWYIRDEFAVRPLTADGKVRGDKYDTWMPFVGCDAMIADMLRDDLKGEQSHAR